MILMIFDYKSPRVPVEICPKISSPTCHGAMLLDGAEIVLLNNIKSREIEQRFVYPFHKLGCV